MTATVILLAGARHLTEPGIVPGTLYDIRVNIIDGPIVIRHGACPGEHSADQRGAAAVTIEGIDEDDGCTGTCCTEPDRRPARPATAHRVRLLTPLPVRTRLRLAVHGRIDRVCAWLCWHRCGRLAGWIWRASGMA